jgi:hypothetical protein
MEPEEHSIHICSACVWAIVGTSPAHKVTSKRRQSNDEADQTAAGFVSAVARLNEQFTRLTVVLDSRMCCGGLLQPQSLD